MEGHSLAPADVSNVFRMIAPCAWLDADTAVGLAEVYGKVSIAMGRFEEEQLFCNRLDRLALPGDVVGIALYRGQAEGKGPWRLLASCWARADGKSSSFAAVGRRARAGEPLTVVFFGGSLTWGANASDPQLTSYRGRMMSYLRERYPRAPFAFYDAAIGGTGSDLGIFRLERDVLSRKPDIVFLDFMANDNYAGTDRETCCFYETLLRRMIKEGVAVEQMYFGFKNREGGRGEGHSETGASIQREAALFFAGRIVR